MISDSKNCSSTPVTLKLRASKKTDPIKSNRDASVIVIVLHHKVWLLQRKELDINIFRQGILTLQLTLLQNIWLKTSAKCELNAIFLQPENIQLCACERISVT